jgi:hypothetical protein
MTNIANIPKTTPKTMLLGMITAATQRILICMWLLLPHSYDLYPPTRMADITAEAAAKRPFDGDCLAVPRLPIFLVALRVGADFLIWLVPLRSRDSRARASPVGDRPGPNVAPCLGVRLWSASGDLRGPN